MWADYPRQCRMGAGLARKAVGEEFSGAGVAPVVPLRIRPTQFSETPILSAIRLWWPQLPTCNFYPISAYISVMDLDRLFRNTAWTEASLAEKAGVHQSTINRLRCGAYGAPLGRALQIQRATAGLVKIADLALSEDARIALRMLHAQGCRHV